MARNIFNQSKQVTSKPNSLIELNNLEKENRWNRLENKLSPQEYYDNI